MECLSKLFLNEFDFNQNSDGVMLMTIHSRFLCNSFVSVNVKEAISVSLSFL